MLARELVESWLDDVFEDRTQALDDLVDRIAGALDGHASIVLPVVDVAAGEHGPTTG